MDKIYSRKRIKVPNVKLFRKKGVFRKRVVIDIILILFIAIITFYIVFKAMVPIMDTACKDAAKAKATMVSNDVATDVMKKYTYDDFVSIYKDNQGNVTMLQSNVVTINEITSSVAMKIQSNLSADDESKVNIKLRKFYRNTYFIRIWTGY